MNHRQVHVPELRDVEKLFAACRGTYTGERDRCVIALMAMTGARIGEVLGLTLDSIRNGDGEKLRVRIERPKGFARENGASHPREILMMPRLVEMYRSWLKVRGNNPGWLICSRDGSRIDSSHYRRKLKQLAGRVGLEGRVHCHAMRHLFAYTYYSRTRDVVALSRLLGHSSITTTHEYLTTIGCQPDLDRGIETIAW